MTPRRILASLYVSLALVAVGCPGDDDDDDGQADSGAQHEGDSGKADSGAGDSKTDAGTTGTAKDGGSGSTKPEGLCADFVKLKQDKAKELNCSGDDSEAVGTLCSVSDSCKTELQAQYNCEKGATTWSCDTGDGHPQTNGACKTSSDAFFACLMTAIHEEDPFGCADAAKAKNDVATELGCNPDNEIENTCNQLHLRKLCLDEWSELTACVDPKPSSDFECDADDDLMPKDGICTAERSSFDDCLANPK